jgi:hypothetical protein
MTTLLTVKLLLYGFIVAEEALLTFCFFRFWRASRETIFAFFSAGFFVMGIHRIVLGMSTAAGVNLGQQTSAFLLRLVSYLLILTGVIVRNARRQRTG